jgi:hypothetical protein
MTALNLEKIVNAHHAAFMAGEPLAKILKEFRAKLTAIGPNFVTLYHGTKNIPAILQEGLRPSKRRRAGCRPSSGAHVYLTICPQRARQFAQMCHPNTDTMVYRVIVPVNRLLPDPISLAEIAHMLPEPIPKSLAASLLFTRCARVSGKIHPNQISLLTET